MSRSEKPAEFFVDRSLGKSIVEGLRDAGLTVHSMADIYSEKRAQLLADEASTEKAVLAALVIGLRPSSASCSDRPRCRAAGGRDHVSPTPANWRAFQVPEPRSATRVNGPP
jgi:hypothetical protein